jgi:ribosomal protein S18 acetylase RimI-like enzyme
MEELSVIYLNKKAPVVYPAPNATDEQGIESKRTYFNEEGKVVGHVTGYFGRTFGIVTELEVEQEYRRLGIATLMVSDVLKQMGQAGIREVLSGPNEKSRGVLNKLGFSSTINDTIMQMNI